jgi:hypothetical protein
VTIDHNKICARDKRGKMLAQLLGIHESEAADLSLSGRLKIIAKLKAARHVEIARGRAGSWLYDVNRHLNLCAALRREDEALAGFYKGNEAPPLPSRSCTNGPAAFPSRLHPPHS